MAQVRRLTTMMLCLALAPGVLSAGQLSDPDRSRARDTVVMVKIKASTNEEAFGAGLIVAASEDSVDIAIPNHLRGGSSGDVTVHVQFAGKHDEWFEATGTPLNAPSLDLMLIKARVPTGQGVGTLAGLVSASSATLEYGASVYPMGFNNGRTWSVPPQADTVDEPPADFRRIVFQTSWVQPGDSGGALLDGCGRIVGMVLRSVSSKQADALRIEHVLATTETLLGRQVVAKPATSPCRPSAPAGTPPDAPPPSCEVQVNSTPADAQVFLDDRPDGTTPRRVNLSRGTQHQLRVEKLGYESYTTRIDCASEPVAPTLRLMIGLLHGNDCSLRLNVDIGGTTHTVGMNPGGQSYSVLYGVPPGEQSYRVTGEIVCQFPFERRPGYSCQAVSDERRSIDVWPGDMYELRWSGPQSGRCVAELFRRQ